jgi:hypothetical protein
MTQVSDVAPGPLVHEVMALGQKKTTNYQFSALFFALLTDIHLIFSTLLCNTKIQIQFKFGFDPLIFHEVMTLGLRKKIKNYISFLSANRYSFDI